MQALCTIMNMATKTVALILIPLIASGLYFLFMYFYFGFNFDAVGLLQFSLIGIYPFGFALLMVGGIFTKVLSPKLHYPFLIFVLSISVFSALWSSLFNASEPIKILFTVAFSCATAILMYPFFYKIYRVAKGA